MSISMTSRRLAVLCFAALVAGCSSTKTSTGSSSTSAPTIKRSSSASSGQVADTCASNRRKCIYEGSYESGERDYAEQEAKRLNTPELERLRRAFGN